MPQRNSALCDPAHEKRGILIGLTNCRRGARHDDGFFGGNNLPNTILITAIGMSLVASGCSSRPRAFSPTLSAPLAGQTTFNQADFDRAYATCNQLLVEGKLDKDGRLVSAAGGAAASGAAAVVGGATAAAVAGYGGMAVAAATVVLLPFALVGGAVGMAKVKRAKKEKAIRVAMTGCLKERGYEITAWTKIDKRDAVKAKSITPAN